MLKINMLTVVMALSLAACKTVEEAAYEQAKQGCTQGGYGEGWPNHAYCMKQLTPAAAQLEQQRRSAQIQLGLSQIANSLDRKPVYAPSPDPEIAMPAPTPPVAHRPTWCMQSVIGGQIICQ